MHRMVKPHPHHLRHTASVIAVGLVDLRFQHGPHVPRLDTDHQQACFGESAEQPLRQRPGFQSDPPAAVGRVTQNLQQGFWLARYLHFPHDPARLIHNADTRLLDRYVQSGKMVHAALLLLMLEAVITDLVSPSARSAAPKIFSYPQAGHGRLPHLYSRKRTSESDMDRKQDLASYSIISSARERSEGGTVRPSAFAVLRLIANSYLFGACTGRSAGFSPLSIRSTYPAASRYWSTS